MYYDPDFDPTGRGLPRDKWRWYLDLRDRYYALTPEEIVPVMDFYLDLSSAERRVWRQAQPDEYQALKNVWQDRDTFKETHPEWTGYFTRQTIPETEAGTPAGEVSMTETREFTWNDVAGMWPGLTADLLRYWAGARVMDKDLQQSLYALRNDYPLARPDFESWLRALRTLAGYGP